MRYSQLTIFAAVLLSFLAICSPAHAGTPMSDRVAVEAKVRAEVSKDLALPYSPGEALTDRLCLDGRAVKDVQGDLVEYWINLECGYCGVREPLQAQRAAPDMCIVVRHRPSDQYGDSLKKALSYEALKKFSVNALTFSGTRCCRKPPWVSPHRMKPRSCLPFRKRLFPQTLLAKP